MNRVTDRILWWTYWFFFKWDWNKAKKKAIITAPVVLIVDALFLPGLISGIVLVLVMLPYALISLIPSMPTAFGIADKAGFIELTKEQSMIRRVFSIIFSDVTEYLEILLDYLFGD